MPILALLVALLTSAVRSAQAQSTAGPRPVIVEYLANEGVLLTRGESVVLIDGLFGDGLAGYRNVPTPTRDSLERALGRFGRIRVILVSHVHRDHFDASALARHLKANPTARVLGPTQVRDSLRLLAGWADRARTSAITPDPAVPFRTEIGDVRLEAHGIRHPTSRNEPVEHLVWRVTIDGIVMLHGGDATPGPEELRRAAGPDGVDLFLAPWWVLGGAPGAERVAATGARRVVAFHVGDQDRPELARGVTVLRQPGQQFVARKR